MAWNIFGRREAHTRNPSAVLAASTDVKAGRVLMAADQTPAAPQAPEVDPLAEFKKSKAY